MLMSAPVPSFANKSVVKQLSAATGKEWSVYRGSNIEELVSASPIYGKVIVFRNKNNDCQGIQFESEYYARSTIAYNWVPEIRTGNLRVFYIEKMKIVILDRSFGDRCSKSIKKKLGGKYYDESIRISVGLNS